MNCKYCNEPIETGVRFCKKCGRPAEQPAAGVVPAMQQRNVIMCPNRHYYDAAEYTSCPHCANAGVQPDASSAHRAVAGVNPIAAAAENSKKKKEKKEKKPFFSFGKKNAQQEPAVPVYNNQPAVNNKVNTNRTVALMDLEDDDAAAPVQAAPQSAPTSAKKAVMRHGAVNKEAAAPAVQEAAVSSEPVKNDEPDKTVSSLLKNEYVAPVSTPAIEQPSVSEPAPVPVAKERPKRDDSSKTIAIYSDLSDDEPVVGWLVCVKGVNFGQSFNLAAGKNTIGRSAMMDVDLTGEDSVSRNTHAIIIYEPKKRQFILKAGDSSGLTYLNDELVLDHEIIKAYDKVQLGECEMIFVPFCNENFTWDTFKEQV